MNLFLLFKRSLIFVVSENEQQLNMSKEAKDGPNWDSHIQRYCFPVLVAYIFLFYSFTLSLIVLTLSVYLYS